MIDTAGRRLENFWKTTKTRALAAGYEWQTGMDRVREMTSDTDYACQEFAGSELYKEMLGKDSDESSYLDKSTMVSHLLDGTEPFPILELPEQVLLWRNLDRLPEVKLKLQAEAVRAKVSLVEYMRHWMIVDALRVYRETSRQSEDLTLYFHFLNNIGSQPKAWKDEAY